MAAVSEQGTHVPSAAAKASATDAQLKALTQGGLVVMRLPRDIVDLDRVDVKFASMLRSDMLAVPHGTFHARTFRDMRQRLHGFVVDTIVSKCTGDDPTWLLEQLLDGAVNVDSDGHDIALGPTLPQADDDTYLVGFVNLTEEVQVVNYIPGSHVNSDLVVASNDSSLGVGEVTASVPPGSLVLLVDTLRHRAIMNSDDLDDNAWCLVVGWRITRTRATTNAAFSRVSMPQMMQNMELPMRRTVSNLQYANALRRMERRREAASAASAAAGIAGSGSDAQYPDGELECFYPRREWVLLSYSGPDTAVPYSL